MVLAPAEPMYTNSASSSAATASASGGVCERLTTRRRRPEARCGACGAGSVVITRSRAGSATADATTSPSSMSATCTAQSVRPSSPNSRVPSSGSTIQTRLAPILARVVDALLGEHGVVGALLGEQLHEQLVRGPIALVAKSLRVLEAELGAQRQQRPAGLEGREAGELVVRSRPRALSPPRSFRSLSAQL